MKKFHVAEFIDDVVDIGSYLVVGIISLALPVGTILCIIKYLFNL